MNPLAGLAALGLAGAAQPSPDTWHQPRDAAAETVNASGDVATLECDGTGIRLTLRLADGGADGTDIGLSAGGLSRPRVRRSSVLSSPPGVSVHQIEIFDGPTEAGTMLRYSKMRNLVVMKGDYRAVFSWPPGAAARSAVLAQCPRRRTTRPTRRLTPRVNCHMLHEQMEAAWHAYAERPSHSTRQLWRGSFERYSRRCDR